MQHLKSTIYLLFIVSLLTCTAGSQKAAEASYAPTSSINTIDIDLNGSWELNAATPRGNNTSKLLITQNEDGITGESDGKRFAIQLDGQLVFWSQERATPMGKMQLEFTGELTDENTMQGTTSMSSGPMAGRKMNWTAKRING